MGGLHLVLTHFLWSNTLEVSLQPARFLHVLTCMSTRVSRDPRLNALHVDKHVQLSFFFFFSFISTFTADLPDSAGWLTLWNLTDTKPGCHSNITCYKFGLCVNSYLTGDERERAYLFIHLGPSRVQRDSGWLHKLGKYSGGHVCVLAAGIPGWLSGSRAVLGRVWCMVSVLAPTICDQAPKEEPAMPEWEADPAAVTAHRN